MTNPLLEPTSDVRAALDAPRMSPLTEAWIKMALATGAIVPPLGDHSQVRVWPWALVGLVCVAGAFAYGALAR